MFLKKTYKYIQLILILLLLTSGNLYSKDLSEKERLNILNYISIIKEFASNFVQSDGKTLEEGSLFIKNKRIRIQYTKPKNIRIIIAENKAMYYNEDLQEVEFFSPKKSIAEHFYNIFYDINFFDESIITKNEGQLIIENNFFVDDEKIKLRIFFEDSPFLIRKLEIYQNNSFINFSIINPNFNPNLDDDFFRMTDPTLK